MNDDLRRIPDAYAQVWEESQHDLTRQRTPTLKISSGKPSSAPPPAGDRFLRSVCVQVARALADAHQAFHDLPAPVEPWGDPQLGVRWTEVDCHVKNDTVVCELVDEWGPDPADLAVRLPIPFEIVGVCRSLQALVGFAATAGADLHLEVAGRHVAGAVRLLTRAGVWDEPVREDIRFCRRDGCVDPSSGLPRLVQDRAGSICSPCTQRAYRERKKAS